MGETMKARKTVLGWLEEEQTRRNAQLGTQVVGMGPSTKRRGDELGPVTETRGDDPFSLLAPKTSRRQDDDSTRLSGGANPPETRSRGDDC
jgi:hypothetical protein